MTSRHVLVVLGKQGAGKGTQCALLAQHLGIPHVSTGDIFRAAVRDRTPLGQEVSAILASGALVSDDLTARLVRERLEQPDAATGVLMDGYPRNASQAQTLDEIVGEGGISLVINLDVPSELVIDRISSRRVCQECGAIYTSTDIEAISGTCEKCGGDVIQRSDDQPDAIAQRLATYERDTAPLLDFYEARGLVVRVDGTGTMSEVTAGLLEVLAERGIS